MTVSPRYLGLVALVAVFGHGPWAAAEPGAPIGGPAGLSWFSLVDDGPSSATEVGAGLRLWVDEKSTETQPHATRPKPSMKQRRHTWCERYDDLVSGTTSYRDLPYVQDFWDRGLSLGELDQTFLAMRKTERHELYKVWKRYRHLIRAAELDRTKSDAHYKSYTGDIMGDPEILALAQQLRSIEKSMSAENRAREFQEFLQIVLAARRPVTVTYDEHRNRTYTSVVSRYHPSPTEMEGGCADSKSMPLFPLERFLAGEAPYVSIALDERLYRRGKIRYGDEFWIPDLDDRYREELQALGIEHIIFRAVDTGDAFIDKGFSRLDLCVTTEGYETRYHAGGKTIGAVQLIKVHRTLALQDAVD